MKKSARWKVAQLAERKWWQRYLEGKDVEEYLRWKSDYWNRLMERIAPSLNLSPGDEALDAGCGPAGIYMALGKYRVTAVDPLLDVYENDLPHFRKNRYPNVNFVTSRLEAYEPGKKFRGVFCMNAINHVSDIRAAAAKLVEWTETGGRLVISADAHRHPLFKHLFRFLPGDILHPHQYDAKEYESMFAGCTPVERLLLKKEFFFKYYLWVFRKI